MALNVDTDKSRNLELLLDAPDFAKFLEMEDFKHYELHKAVERNKNGVDPVMANVSFPYLFKTYYNLNCFKDLLKIDFCNTYWWTQVHILRNIWSAQKKLGNQRYPVKVINSDFNLRLRSKPHLQNCLTDSKDFLTQTAQGRKDVKIKIVDNRRYGGHIFRYGRWFPSTHSFWDTQYTYTLYFL